MVDARLADIVNCTSVKTALPCCATCGRQPLPDIHLRGSKRVDHGMLHDVPLESVAAQFPWLRLTPGGGPAVVLAWLHLFRVGNPRMWKLPLAHLKVGANEATMQGLRDVLCSALECISDTSKHGLAFTAREASDVAGVREGELPPQADIFGTALPQAQPLVPPSRPASEDIDAPLCPTMHFLEVAPLLRQPCECTPSL